MLAAFRRIVVLLAVLFLALSSAPPAFAIEPPAIDPSAVPPDATGPDQPTELRRVCSSPTSFPGANFADKPWANDYLRISDAQKFATGAGVTVAVIDTGVNGSARVPALPGGDFVDKAGDGMNDCDWSPCSNLPDHQGQWRVLAADVRGAGSGDTLRPRVVRTAFGIPEGTSVVKLEPTVPDMPRVPLNFVA